MTKEVDVTAVENEATTATTLDGRKLAETLRDELRHDCATVTAQLGHAPVLAVLSVGDDPAAESYLNSIRRGADRIGILCRPVRLVADTSAAELSTALLSLNVDREVCGVLVTLPLPPHLPVEIVADTLAPAKDIDGITPASVGRLSLGWPAFAPNTPAGGMEILRRYGIDVAGKHAVVVGRSGIVGRPMAALLVAANATVTICHSYTRNLIDYLRSADIVVAAAGRPHLITGAMLKPGAVVIDFGINFPEWSAGKMVGDVDFASALPVASAITPVPGGTGPVTNMMLMRNVIVAARALIH